MSEVNYGEDLLEDMAKAMSGVVSEKAKKKEGQTEALDEFSNWLSQNYGHSSPIIPDGNYHPINSDTDMRYVYHADSGIGVVYNWHSDNGKEDTFYPSTYEALSPSDKARARRAMQDFMKSAQEEQERVWKEKAKECAALLVSETKMKPLASIHGYLLEKGYKDLVKDVSSLGLYECTHSHGMGQTRQWKGQIVVPYWDSTGHISTLEALLDVDHHITGKDGKERNKDWYKEAKKKGSFHPIGFTSSGANIFTEPCYLAEGYATALAVHLATGKPCVACGDAGNIQYVAPLFINCTGIADYDVKDAKGEKSMQAASVPYILMKDESCPEKSMDADDFLRAKGKEGLRQFIDSHMDAVYSQMAFPPLWWQLNHISEDDYIINDWLLRGGLHALVGDAGKGKSFIALDIAMSLATGRESWGGRKVNGKSKVAYLCGEAYNSFRLRINAWLMDRGFTVGQVEPYFALTKCIFKMDEKEDQEALDKALKTLPWTPDVLIVDTFSRYFSGDENDSTEAKEFLDYLHHLADSRNMAVLYLSHFNKVDKTQQSGSKEWLAQNDFAYAVACDNELGKSIEGHQLSLMQTKSKDGEPLGYSFIPRKVELGTRVSDGLPITSLVLDADETPVRAKEQRENDRRLSKEEKELKAKEEEDFELINSIFDNLVDDKDWKKTPYKVAPQDLKKLLTRAYTEEELEELDSLQGSAKTKKKKSIDNARTKPYYTAFGLTDKYNFIRRCKTRGWADWIVDPQKPTEVVAYIFTTRFNPNYWTHRNERKRDFQDLLSDI